MGKPRKPITPAFWHVHADVEQAPCPVLVVVKARCVVGALEAGQQALQKQFNYRRFTLASACQVI